MPEETQPRAGAPDVHDLLGELERLSEAVESEAAREQIAETIAIAKRVQYPGVFGRVIRGFDRADAAEAFVGSVVFGIPLLVESGTLEIGAYIADHPAYFAGTIGLGVAIVIGLLYVADFQQVEVTRPILGLLPRRLVGVLGISFATSLVLMTVWGRVDWAAPVVALAQVSFVFVAMAIGAALGDILPGS